MDIFFIFNFSVFFVHYWSNFYARNAYYILELSVFEKGKHSSFATFFSSLFFITQ